MTTGWGAVCVAAGAVLASAGGCVEQELQVDTNPDGALVFMNDQEVGRTPIRRPFTWYGTYDVVVRKEGYQTLRTKAPVIAPAWNWVPFDLLATALPIRFTDTQRLKFELKPDNESVVDPDRMIRGSRELQQQLESGTRTIEKARATRPATAPSTKRAPGPATGATTLPASQPLAPRTADQG